MKLSGIYKIQSIIKPERYYIGSAINIKKRWYGHKYDLKNNVHHTSKLQRHYNKYGADDLIYLIIEECTPELLIKREQYYIDELKPFFNSNPIAGSRLGAKHNEKALLKMRKPRSEKGRENIRKSNKTLGTHPTKETLEKLSKQRLGIPKSEKHKANMRKPKPPGFRQKIKDSWIIRKRLPKL